MKLMTYQGQVLDRFEDFLRQWRREAEPIARMTRSFIHQDQAETRRMGEFWARHTRDRRAFVMPKKRDWSTVVAAPNPG